MSYENFAYYYDSLMDPQFYDDYLKFILDHANFDEVLELGCGTGEIAIRLAKKNKKIFASDLSSDMLEVAKQKAIHENVNLMLQRVDMTDFSTSYPVDLILCLCDSLNYVLSSRSVYQTFKNVYASLKENGTFIFDVNSLYKMNTILNDYHEQEEDDEFKFQWDVKVTEPGSVVHHVYIEDKVENEIVDENHYQRTFSVAQYKEWLVKAGFTDINCFSDFEEYKEECERIIFVCTKGVNA